ncbi:hypothetical protein AK830_g5144 [Neonectria ditissima]|uniref:Uncharacterized protein n=1 Tax=Neonectria ditissima TaxID=78410 RepID=A0A0N8H7D2_9HYPO|nr:hypothetical protein AK830_g5144 [Neonectria ditissima]
MKILPTLFRDTSLGPSEPENHFSVALFGSGSNDHQYPANTRAANELEKDWAYQICVPWLFDQTRAFLKYLDFQREPKRDKDGYQVVPNPSWGFCIVLTIHSQQAHKNVPRAVFNLMEAVWRYSQQSPAEEHSEEVNKRFRLLMIENQSAFQNASDERIREKFNSFVEAIRYGDDKDQNYYIEGNRPYNLIHYGACLVLDEAKVEELAGLKFGDSIYSDRQALRHVRIKMIDRFWSPPLVVRDMPTWREKEYQGVDECPIYGTSHAYKLLMENTPMADLFPLHRQIYGID